MIELKNVSYIYPHTAQAALRNLYFTLPRGACVMVTGASGSGKTTLCLASSGILHHEYGGKKEGDVIIGGRDVASYSGLSEVAGTIGMVFDDAEAQMIFTTVEEEILSALEHRGLTVAEIEDRLESVMVKTRLTELKNRSPHNLSGGQKQRVALAATLALGNEVIILDEPTSELDEHATRRIAGILSDLKKEGKTILLVEHKFSHFRDMIDTLVVMENGRIRASGDPNKVLADPAVRSIVIPDFSGIRRDHKTHDSSIQELRPAISISDLRYSYGDIPALDGIDLEIRAGEFVAIVGENGSGKTTLVKHFNNLLTPTSGTVRIMGKDTRECTITELARHVGLVFQNPDHMFFADTVREEIAFGLHNLGIPDPEKKIDAALANAGLQHTLDLYPRWLSRGERQRLAIACVIAMQPAIIVLDEPTTGLDGNEARQVLEIVRDFQEKGHTIVVITHNRDIAIHCADRVIGMEKGKILSDNPTGVT